MFTSHGVPPLGWLHWQRLRTNPRWCRWVLAEILISWGSKASTEDPPCGFPELPIRLVKAMTVYHLVVAAHMHLQGHPDCYSTFVNMIDPAENDDACSRTDITNLTMLELLERVSLHSIHSSNLYSGDIMSHNPSRECFVVTPKCGQDDNRNHNVLVGIKHLDHAGPRWSSIIVSVVCLCAFHSCGFLMINVLVARHSMSSLAFRNFRTRGVERNFLKVSKASSSLSHVLL